MPQMIISCPLKELELADEDGLPAGFQILAPAAADERLYAVGAALEQRLLESWGGPLLGKAPDLSTMTKGA